jgi:uncharacterized protein (DUF433 family)
MARPQSVVQVFGADEIERLTGLKPGRLRYWQQTNFFGRPSDRFPATRSFEEVRNLRTLGKLIAAGVPLQHLRKVKARLGTHAHDDRFWARRHLLVLGREVVFDDEGKLSTAVGQRILDLPLKDIDRELQRDIAKLRARRPEAIGQTERRSAVLAGAPVIAGTRVPVSGIKAWAAAGLDPADILKQYPSLRAEDVEAVLAVQAA